MEVKIFLPNKSGLKLAAVLHKPERSGKFPAVVVLHGNTGYKEEGHIEGLARALAENGIGAIRFDASGYGESEGTIEDDYRFSNYMQDAQVVYEYLSNLEWVEKDKVGVCGQSMGGMIALILAKNNPTIASVCIISAPTQMGTSNNTKDKLEEWERTGYLERVSSKFGKMKIPWAFMEDARKYNALDYIKDVHTPLFAIWGTDDTNVPIEQTKEIYERANNPKEFWEVPGMDHFPKRNAEILPKLINGVVNFFKKTLTE